MLLRYPKYTTIIAYKHRNVNRKRKKTVCKDYVWIDGTFTLVCYLVEQLWSSARFYAREINPVWRIQHPVVRLGQSGDCVSPLTGNLRHLNHTAVCVAAGLAR